MLTIMIQIVFVREVFPSKMKPQWLPPYSMKGPYFEASSDVDCN